MVLIIRRSVGNLSRSVVDGEEEMKDIRRRFWTGKIKTLWTVLIERE